MEAYLQEKSDFSVADVAVFDDFFVIITNGRLIQDTPATYRGTLQNVSYDLGGSFESEQAVIITFIIHLNFLHKLPQSLWAISIFKFIADNVEKFTF